MSLSKNLERQSCSAINYMYSSNGIKILAGDHPVPVLFGPKGRKDVRFTFHAWRAVQSAIADLLVLRGRTKRCICTSLNDSSRRTVKPERNHLPGILRCAALTNTTVATDCHSEPDRTLKNIRSISFFYFITLCLPQSDCEQ